MFIKQLSVFIENREGRLDDVTGVLFDNGIDIKSCSLADTSEYGMLRLIVSEPEKAQFVLKESGFSAKLVDVASIRITNKPGSLSTFLKECSDGDLNIDYMYGLTTSSEDAVVIVKFSDRELAEKVLTKAGY